LERGSSRPIDNDEDEEEGVGVVKMSRVRVEEKGEEEDCCFDFFEVCSGGVRRVVVRKAFVVVGVIINRRMRRGRRVEGNLAFIFG